MNGNGRKILWGIALVPIVLLAWVIHLYRSAQGQAQAIPPVGSTTLQILITDPLCRASTGVEAAKCARHDYSLFAACLEQRLGRPVRICCADNLSGALGSRPPTADLLIGPASVIRSEAAKANESIRPIARLTDKDGSTDFAGLFIVRRTDPAHSIRDLTNHRILFGPAGAQERHGAAIAMMAEHGVAPVPPVRTSASCTAAALAVVEGSADAAVISDYARPLLDGHAGIDRDALRMIGQTAPIPFITVFATSVVTENVERQIVDALLSMRQERAVLDALDSQAGFVEAEVSVASQAEFCAPPQPAAWPDWRGEGRSALSRDVPARLPSRVNYLWRYGLTGAGLSGVTATSQYVLVADKSSRKDQDIWRCLDDDTGQEVWTIAYATPTEMEFTNAPRATPVIHGDLAYLLGAFGDLHCVSLSDSRILWRRNIIKDFGAELATWGMCSTPLVVDDKLIVNPGAPDASLASLSLETGEVFWKTPGEQAAYASMILGTFGGVRQIVGYDAVSLGGWDPNTGRRLWNLLPPQKGDFNVVTPLNANGRLLVSTAKNGTRLYEFGADGQILPVPVAWNSDLKPDTSTPVVIRDMVFGCSGGLFCLDLANNLKTLYRPEGDTAFKNHAAFIGGDNRVLAASAEGELVLFRASRDGYTPLSRLQLFRNAEVWSHPALVGDRLYIRSMNEVCCILLGGADDY